MPALGALEHIGRRAASFLVRDARLYRLSDEFSLMGSQSGQCQWMLRNSLPCGSVSFERWDGSSPFGVALRQYAERWQFSGDVGSLPDWLGVPPLEMSMRW